MSDKILNTANVITGSLCEKIRRCRAVKTSKGDGIPMMIYGSPGVGKSEQVAQALEDGELMIDLRLNSLDSIDLRGLPIIRKDENRRPTEVKWVRPEFIPDDDGVVVEARGILLASSSWMKSTPLLLVSRIQRCSWYWIARLVRIILARIGISVLLVTSRMTRLMYILCLLLCVSVLRSTTTNQTTILGRIGR